MINYYEKMALAARLALTIRDDPHLRMELAMYEQLIMMHRQFMPGGVRMDTYTYTTAFSGDLIERAYTDLLYQLQKTPPLVGAIPGETVTYAEVKAQLIADVLSDLETYREWKQKAATLTSPN